jgi:hypothetical protein
MGVPLNRPQSWRNREAAGPVSRRHPGAGISPTVGKRPTLEVMSMMNISLPETLKDFVDQQVAEGGYGTSSEYVRELIRKDQDRRRDESA